MSIRDIVFVVILAGLVPASFFRPWVGVLAWSWIAYMAPHRLTWGFAQTLPVAMLIGGATLAGLLFTKDRKPFPRTPEVLLLLAMAVHFTITSFFAINPDLAWGKWSWVLKTMLMAFVMLWLFQDRAKLRSLYMVIALSLGFYGLKGALWVARTGGSNRVFGPEDTFFEDNNTLGLALAMALPMLLCLSREEPRKWLRWLLRLMFAGSIVSILFTHSRGAFLGLAVILFIQVWRSPWRLRFGAAVAIAAVLALPFIPMNLKERIASIQEYQEDRSVIGRFQAWSMGFQLAMDRPLVGGGFRAYHNDEVWDRYHQGAYNQSRDAHSLYFEVLGEHGFWGFGLYLTLVITVLIGLKQIKRRWLNHPEHGWLSNYADMTQMAMYPFLIAGAFIGVAYFDLFFHLAGLTAILKVLSEQAKHAVTQPATPAPAAARRALSRAEPRPSVS